MLSRGCWLAKLTRRFFREYYSLGIPPQGTSTGQGWSERTPYTDIVAHPYLYFLSPPPPLRGWWGGLTMLKSMLLMPMVRLTT